MYPRTNILTEMRTLRLYLEAWRNGNYAEALKFISPELFEDYKVKLNGKKKKDNLSLLREIGPLKGVREFVVHGRESGRGNQSLLTIEEIREDGERGLERVLGFVIEEDMRRIRYFDYKEEREHTKQRLSSQK